MSDKLLVFVFRLEAGLDTDTHELRLVHDPQVIVVQQTECIGQR